MAQGFGLDVSSDLAALRRLNSELTKLVSETEGFADAISSAKGEITSFARMSEANLKAMNVQMNKAVNVTAELTEHGKKYIKAMSVQSLVKHWTDMHLALQNLNQTTEKLTQQTKLYTTAEGKANAEAKIAADAQKKLAGAQAQRAAEMRLVEERLNSIRNGEAKRLELMKTQEAFERKQLAYFKSVQLALAANKKVLDNWNASAEREVAISRQQIQTRRQLAAEEAKIKGQTELSAKQLDLLRKGKYDELMVNRQLIKAEMDLAKARAMANPQVAKLNQQATALNAVTAATQRATAAEATRRRGLRLSDQLIAGFRSSLLGLQTSIGIYTSSTVLFATAMYGLTRAFRSGIETGIEFTQEMANAQTIMRSMGEAENFSLLENRVISLAKTTQFTMTEVAKASTELAKIGLDQAQAVAALEPTLNLSIVGNMSLADSAKAATDIMLMFHKSTAELPDVVDKLAVAATNSSATIDQLVNSMTYAGPAAEAVGFRMEEVLAATEALANQGIRGSKAGTALRRLFERLVKPTAAGAKWIKEFDLNVTDAFERTRSFTDIIHELGAKLEELPEGKRLAAITDIVGVHAQSSVAALTSGLDGYDKALRELNNSLGRGDEMRKGMQDALKFDILEMKSAAEALQTVVFNNYATQFRIWAQELRGFFDYMSEQVDGGVTRLELWANRIFHAGRALALAFTTKKLLDWVRSQGSAETANSRLVSSQNAVTAAIQRTSAASAATSAALNTQAAATNNLANANRRMPGAFVGPPAPGGGWAGGVSKGAGGVGAMMGGAVRLMGMLGLVVSVGYMLKDLVEMVAPSLPRNAEDLARDLEQKAEKYRRMQIDKEIGGRVQISSDTKRSIATQERQLQLTIQSYNSQMDLVNGLDKTSQEYEAASRVLERYRERALGAAQSISQLREQLKKVDTDSSVSEAAAKNFLASPLGTLSESTSFWGGSSTLSIKGQGGGAGQILQGMIKDSPEAAAWVNEVQAALEFRNSEMRRLQLEFNNEQSQGLSKEFDSARAAELREQMDEVTRTFQEIFTSRSDNLASFFRVSGQKAAEAIKQTIEKTNEELKKELAAIIHSTASSGIEEERAKALYKALSPEDQVKKSIEDVKGAAQSLVKAQAEVEAMIDKGFGELLSDPKKFDDKDFVEKLEKELAHLIPEGETVLSLRDHMQGLSIASVESAKDYNEALRRYIEAVAALQKKKEAGDERAKNFIERDLEKALSRYSALQKPETTSESGRVNLQRDLEALDKLRDTSLKKFKITQGQYNQALQQAAMNYSRAVVEEDKYQRGLDKLSSTLSSSAYTAANAYVSAMDELVKVNDEAANSTDKNAKALLSLANAHEYFRKKATLFTTPSMTVSGSAGDLSPLANAFSSAHQGQTAISQARLGLGENLASGLLMLGNDERRDTLAADAYLEALRSRKDVENSVIEKAEQDKLNMLASYQQQREFMTQDATDRLNNIEAAHADFAKQQQLGIAAGMADALGNMAGSISRYTEEGSRSWKAAIALQKSMAVISILLNAHIASAQAMAAQQVPGVPASTFLGMSLSKAILAMGYANASMVTGMAIADLSSSGSSGMHDAGGTIPRGKWGIVGEVGPEIVEGPAMVRSRKNTKQMLNGSGGGTTIAPVINIEYSGGVGGDPSKDATNIANTVKGVILQTLERELRPNGMLYRANRG